MITPVAKLNARHYKIIDYCIAGKNNKQIADELSMTQRQVSIITNSPQFQHQLAIRRKGFEEDLDEKLASTETETASVLKDASRKAAQTLALGLVSQSDAIKIRSAEAILDRTGNPRNIRSLDDNNEKTIVHITRNDLLLLKETLELENSICNSNKGFDPRFPIPVQSNTVGA